MIILLAPSKTLNFETAAPVWVNPSTTHFADDTQRIIAELQRMTQSELATLMHASQPIAQLARDRLDSWGNTQKPALWAYRGDVYKGMYADTLTQQDSNWAQKHLLILSGLYGVVRPCDLIAPYRLEMKAKLSVGTSKNLYEFWSHRLAEYVDGNSNGIICNLSSTEYALPVTKYTHSRVITPVFIDHRPNGKIGPAPIYNKMMRGVMAYWMIKNQVDDPSRLQEFTGHGYVFDQTLSHPDAPVFIRGTMKPLVF